MTFGVSNFETAADKPNLTPETPGMAHMAGNEANYWYFIKKHEVKKSVPKKCKTAWALGLNVWNWLIAVIAKANLEIGTIQK